MPSTRSRYGTAYRTFTAGIAVWMTGVIVAGFALSIPRLNILEESARNLYFHVPMWFTLMAGMLVSAVYSARYLAAPTVERDVRAEQAALVAMLFGILGLVTGIVWARFTWYVGTGKWWNFDPKQSMAAVQLMILAAYFVLRSSVEEPRKRGRIAAVYNLFATAVMPFLLYVLPRQLDSLHPGAEGNPAFSQTDLAPEMRVVFYPAVVGFIALFWWIYTQRVRVRLAERQVEEAVLVGA
ncbi:MAG: cytochrome c biogenesis protein CcsA [Bacteroidota bacterium]